MKKRFTVKAIVLLMILAILPACQNKNQNNTSNSSEAAGNEVVDEGNNNENTKFPEFEARYMDGEEVETDLFSQKAVTVLNFWSINCPPCVKEIPILDDLDKSLTEKDGQVVGANLDRVDLDKDLLEEAQKMMEQQGASYKSIYFNLGSDAGNYVRRISVVPTTILINREGEIVGDPIVGSMISEDLFKELNERIEKIIAEDKSN
jgi:thiol-disulfide isomerase/thioredoxin